MPDGYTIACYYYPAHHVDPRNEAIHGPGWTEWDLVKVGGPRFDGHRQPRTPLWGYQDEADPQVMAGKIDAAAGHGVDVFIFDWFWYDDGPFLQRCLEEGFLGASNCNRIEFAIMWANHDWLDIHPAKRTTIGDRAPLLFPGAVTPQTFDALTDHVIDRYFSHTAYWQVEERPYFSIFDLSKLIEGLGGKNATRDALNRFEEKTRAAGFPGLHLNVTLRWGLRELLRQTGIKNIRDLDSLLHEMGFDSVTSYHWYVLLDEFPSMPYERVRKAAVNDWNRMADSFNLPYHPNVMVGWDPSPRTVQSDRFTDAGYPFMTTFDCDPIGFQEMLLQAKGFLDARGAGERILTLHAWNEWSEGSYLEPDTVYGLEHLQKIGAVFGSGGDGARPPALLRGRDLGPETTRPDLPGSLTPAQIEILATRLRKRRERS